MSYVASPKFTSVAIVSKRSVTRTLVFFTRVAGFIGVAFASYLMAMFAAGWATPRLMASVAAGMGINLDTASLAGFGTWLMSSAVIVLLMAAVVAVSVRGLWRIYLRAIVRVEARLASV